MTEKDVAETSKTSMQIEFDDLFESIRQDKYAQIDQDRLEWLRNRMTSAFQVLRDMNIHRELGLPLSPELMARSRINYEVWKVEWHAGTYKLPIVLRETIPEILAMESRSTQSTVSSVPSVPETIISYVCTPDRLEAVLGDLERNFVRRAAKHGEKAARRWYWWQTARTVGAFGVQIVVRVVFLRELLTKLGR